MPSYDYVLYDTAEFGTSPGTWFDLFQVAQGGDAVHTESFTNSRGAGSLPNDESFSLENLGVMVEHDVNEADVAALWRDSIIEVRVGDQTKFKAPLAVCAKLNSFGGAYGPASAGALAHVGLHGNGYQFKNAISIPGGQSFKIRVYQGTALQAANSSVKILLDGVLTRN